MDRQKPALLIFALVLLSQPLFASQREGESSPCAVVYENHNQIDYGPLVVQEVEGTVVGPQQTAISKACVSVFTEKDHKLLATTLSDANGKFSLQSLPTGRYRLVVSANPLCAANVLLRVVKHSMKKRILQVHMKARGLDTCSYGEALQSKTL